jgi:hypothetical protein
MFRSTRLRSMTSACLFALVLTGSACAADHASTEPSGPPLLVADGDQQAGTANERLGTAITVRVVDALGQAHAGVVVQWSASDDGAVVPETSTTDSAGEARTLWTLGPPTGLQHLTAAADGYAKVRFSATAAAGPRDGPIVVFPLETFDGSGQTVHPDFVATPAPWGGASPRYLVATPYRGGSSAYENPSLYGGNGTVSWTPPDGVVNPIATPTSGYLSDPDAVYLPDKNELRVYYRSVDGANIIQMISSTDGVHFTDPLMVAARENHAIVSPTVVRRSATDWLMWSVNANVGCTAANTLVEVRRSTDGIGWSNASPVALTQKGYSVWHIDVQWIPSRHEYWALYNVKTGGSCTTPALYLATSPDGVTWKTYSSPVLSRGAIREFADVVYRSTFAYDSASDVIDFWYSGARYDAPNYVWRSAYQRRPRRTVFATIGYTSNHALADQVPRPGVPPLLDPP